jgi:glutaminyl-peptide cyclotransferase
MGWCVIPNACGWRAISRMTLVPVLLAVLISIASPLIHWSQSTEAQDPMPATPAPIDGQRAYEYLKKICDLGPRVAGTEANARQRRMVAEHFSKNGATVREQPFRAPHPLNGRTVNMVNLIGSWHPDRTERVLICAHYDTRPHADEEQDPLRLRQPFIGANDGGSGVALLMELANHMDKLETPWGVDLVLLDGEELVYGNNPRAGEYFLGSKVFAKHYANRARGGPKMHYVCGILLDMVGGKDMQIKREPGSLDFAPKLVSQVWAVARQLDAKSFTNDIGREVQDDHVPLNEIGGIPTIDLIDFDYPHWHKIDDVPANCSAQSLAEVGRVLTGWLSLPQPGGSRR